MAKKQDKNSDRALEVMFGASNAKAKKAKKEKKKKTLPADDVAPAPKKRLGSKGVLIIITAAVLLGAIIATSVFFIIDAYNKDENFDYIESNLSKYLEFTDSSDDNSDSSDDDSASSNGNSAVSYKDYTIDIAIAPPHTKNEDGTGVSDVEVAILNLIASERTLVGDGVKQTNLTVGAGDNVYIWYRGYLKHPETGEKIVVSGMSNFGNSTSSELGIGTGSFVPGFELGLVGTDPTQYARFIKITEGSVDPTQHVAYVSYTRQEYDTENDVVKGSKQTGTKVRVDLKDSEDAEELFGAGFISAINGTAVGQKLEFKTTINGTTYKYTDTTVDFVTTCEDTATNGGIPIKTVECYFPYDYGTTGLSSASLRNETAYFEVYIEFVQDYSVPEWGDEYLKEYLAESGSPITEAELTQKYEGNTLVQKYEAYVAESLQLAYEEERRALIEDAMWAHYLDIVKVNRYPGNKVDEIYDEYVDDVYYQFDTSGGGLTNSDGEYETYEDIDSFACAYLSLDEGADWKSVLKTMSQELVKERLILYYIMKAENLTPTEEVLNAKYEALRAEYLDEYIKQYLEYEEKTRADYTDEEYATFVADREKEIFDYYDEDYFTETAYYEIVLDTLVNWPTVNDLTDGAYNYS